MAFGMPQKSIHHLQIEFEVSILISANRISRDDDLIRTW
jgi:hypothetical protein